MAAPGANGGEIWEKGLKSVSFSQKSSNTSHLVFQQDARFTAAAALIFLKLPLLNLIALTDQQAYLVSNRDSKF